jgi:hypothetical protein
MYKLIKNIMGAGGNNTLNIVQYPNYIAIDEYVSVKII